MLPDEVWSALDAFARGLEPGPRHAFLKAIRKLQADLPQSVLDEAVKTGDVQPILDALDLTDYKLAVRESLLEAASNKTLLPFDVRFDSLDPWAIRAIQTAEFSLMQGLTTDIANGIRTFLTAGIRFGVNPVDTARDIRTIIGLTDRQALSVLNYRQLLTGGAKGQPYREALRRVTRDGRFDRSVLRAIEEKVPLKASQVDAQIKRFEERLLKQRAETIARTETMDALHQAQTLRWQQAIDQGKVNASELVRFWHTAKDERVCPICAKIPGLNEQGRGFNEPFAFPDGETKMGPTAHPNCRCVVFIRIVFAKQRTPLLLRTWAAELSGLRRAA
jgi:hypothetical protein